jgi:hypothetical protein
MIQASTMSKPLHETERAAEVSHDADESRRGTELEMVARGSHGHDDERLASGEAEKKGTRNAEENISRLHHGAEGYWSRRL